MGLVLAHYATRALLVEAADEASYGPDRTSFIRGPRVVRRQVTDQAAIPPEHLAEAITESKQEILRSR